MDVTVRIPGVVKREFGFESREIAVTLDESASVRDALDTVAEQYPGSEQYFHRKGEQHDDIQVLVNGSAEDDFTRSLEDGDQLQVALPIAGG